MAPMRSFRASWSIAGQTECLGSRCVFWEREIGFYRQGTHFIGKIVDENDQPEHTEHTEILRKHLEMGDPYRFIRMKHLSFRSCFGQWLKQ